MKLDALHQNTQKQLKAALSAPAHAYLFYGPKYMYKQRVAEEFAVSLVGGSGVLDPNIITVGAGDSSSIKISDIRLVLDQLAHTPYRDTSRVVIVSQAHTMTVDASNALLKALEEPQGGVVFVLVSSQPQRLLPTIRSRVQQIGFVPTSIDDYITAPRLRSEMATDDNLRAAREGLESSACEFLDSSLTKRFAIAKQTHEDKTTAEFVEVLEAVVSAEAPSRASLYAWFDKLIAVEDQLAHNLNPRLCIENLALELSR